MRIKYQVDQIEEIFNKLDRGSKGFIAYNDFCLLSEEKRRGIDAFDLGTIIKTPNPKASPFDMYLQETNIEDLEDMTKVKFLPKQKMKNDHHVFGKKSNAANCKVSQLVTGQFNRDFL